MISFDDFFHTWDEQYHALVAKNLADNPLMPTLYRLTPLEFDFRNWTSNHIWLHKQPWFLWQMALCIKIFGATAYAPRIPSMLMMSLLILLVYRIGKITFNEKTGYLAALLFATCNYLLDFVTGINITDHNDIAFIFYVSTSLWAYTEFTISNNQKYVWIIGISAGIAVLNKWLVGLLVFSGWMGVIIFLVPRINKVPEFKNVLKTAAISLCVFIPWQIYILYKFPLESKNEFAYNTKHFWEAVENHSGSFWFHFQQAPNQYGVIAALLLPIALMFAFIKMPNPKIKVAYIIYILITYLFFSFSKTKMPAFCLIVSPILFIALGHFLNTLLSFLNLEQRNLGVMKGLVFLFLLAISGCNINIENLQRNHTNWKTKDTWAYFREELLQVTEVAKSIRGKYNIDKTVVLNCGSNEGIPMMYFSGYIAYDKIPEEKEFQQLKNQHFNILFVDPYGSIPEYIQNDSSIIYISNPTRFEQSRNKVHLMAYNSKYVCDDLNLNHELYANRTTAGLWETFTLIQFKNDKCAFRSWTNEFVCADIGSSKNVVANRKTMGEWEVFTIVHLKNNVIALKASDGCFLACGTKCNLFVSSKILRENEKFRIIVLN